MSNRLQWEKFWYRDFFDDVACLSLSARGFWISCLCRMWGNGRGGQITGSFEEFSRMIGCGKTDVETAINELEINKICRVVWASRPIDCNGDVMLCNKDVTLICRRLEKEKKLNDLNRMRVHRFREKVKCNAPVTGEKKEEEKKEETNTSFDDQMTPVCPHQEILNLYHKILPNLPPVKKWTEDRRKLLKARWSEDPKRQKLDYWQNFFSHVAQSEFLMGNGGRGWRANLEWLLKPRNFTNVIEGLYHK